jgi:transcriptional regulator with XRE-family HTH domain
VKYHPKALQREILQNLLKDIRKKAGLRQKDLAEKIGVHQTFISKYETGERRLDLIDLIQVCKAIGVPLPEFSSQLVESLKDSGLY